MDVKQLKADLARHEAKLTKLVEFQGVVATRVAKRQSIIERVSARLAKAEAAAPVAAPAPAKAAKAKAEAPAAPAKKVVVTKKK